MASTTLAGDYLGRPDAGSGWRVGEFGQFVATRCERGLTLSLARRRSTWAGRLRPNGAVRSRRGRPRVGARALVAKFWCTRSTQDSDSAVKIRSGVAEDIPHAFARALPRHPRGRPRPRSGSTRLAVVDDHSIFDRPHHCILQRGRTWRRLSQRISASERDLSWVSRSSMADSCSGVSPPWRDGGPSLSHRRYSHQQRPSSAGCRSPPGAPGVVAAVGLIADFQVGGAGYTDTGLGPPMSQRAVSITCTPTSMSAPTILSALEWDARAWGAGSGGLVFWQLKKPQSCGVARRCGREKRQRPWCGARSPDDGSKPRGRNTPRPVRRARCTA